MTLAKAFHAFFQVLFGKGECPHPHVNLLQAPTYCPDCGYGVKIEWVFLHCRGCNTRRVPKQTLTGHIKPVQQFCRHCGLEGTKMVKKDHIEAYELMYAVAMKSTSYSELPTSEPAIFNPFRKTTVKVESGDVFEAEVIRKTEFRGTRRAFKGSSFEWQRNQNPSRYGGSYSEPVAQETNLLPLRKLS